MEFDRPCERSPEKHCLLGLTFYILRESHYKQSFSGLLSPGRSKSTDVCSPWVQMKPNEITHCIQRKLTNRLKYLTFYNLRDKQSFSGLLSPGRSKSTDVCSPWVQIIFHLKFFILDNALHVGLNFSAVLFLKRPVLQCFG